MSNGSGQSYFGGAEPRHYDMMPYGQQQGGFYGHHYGLPPHIAGFMQHPPPGPPATEHPGRTKTPAAEPEPKPDPATLKLEAELQALKLEQQKNEERGKAQGF